MKLTKFYGFALTALAASALVACSNELREPSANLSDGLKLAKAPDVTAWSGNHTFSNTKTVADLNTIAPSIAQNIVSPSTQTRAEEDEKYFSVESVTGDWTDAYKMNGKLEGPENVLAFLKHGITDTWIDLDENPWVKVEWINQKNDHNSWASVTIPASFPDGTKGDKAIEKLNSNFAIKATQGYSLTFYPYLSGDTDQKHKEIGLFYYDANGNKHEEKIWEGEVTGYKDGKIDGVKVTINKDCVFGLYFSGRTHYANEDDTYYFSLEELNEQSVESDFPDIKVHAGLIPDEALNGFYNGHVLMVEDWDDFDFDDFIIFFTGDLEIVNDDTIKNCEQCNHPNHDGENCDQCEEGSTCNPKDEEVCPVPGCGHTKHDGENCDQCEEGTTCNPKDEEVCPVPGCGHTKHDGENCDQCPEGSTCNPKDEDPNCPVPGCGHPKHDGQDCDQCDEGTTCHPIHEEVVTNPTKSEVEVNLAINDQHAQYSGINDLVAKLSIHVRMAGDVKIVIPLGWNATLDNDDLIILNKHEDGLLAHGGKDTQQVVTYPIGGQTVTLTFTFDENYITITTDGINEEVFNYCKETYGDGINFEAYLYLNDKTPLNRETFKAILDQATIEFLDGCPDYYINAFTDTKDDDNRSIDCTVSIVEEQEGSYTPGQNPGHHLNGSDKNVIYKKDGVDNENPNNEHNHQFLWGE